MAETKREIHTQTKRSPKCWLTSQMPVIFEATSDQTQESTIRSRYSSYNNLTHHLQPPRVHTSRKLESGAL